MLFVISYVKKRSRHHRGAVLAKHLSLSFCCHVLVFLDVMRNILQNLNHFLWRPVLYARLPMLHGDILHGIRRTDDEKAIGKRITTLHIAKVEELEPTRFPEEAPSPDLSPEEEGSDESDNSENSETSEEKSQQEVADELNGQLSFDF